MKISRSIFRQAIASGIESADLPAEFNDKLRELAKTADRIGVGTYTGDCVCPLSRVGVTDPENGARTDRALDLGISVAQVHEFAGTFDRVIDAEVRRLGGPRAVESVEIAS